MALQIKNLKTVTFRTDCFAPVSEDKHHLRKTQIDYSVTFNKGTPSEFTNTYTPYKQGYTKHRDIQAVFPDQSQKSLEIGYNTRSSNATNPIIADKLLLFGDFSLGDVQYTSLKFQSPALGVKSRSSFETDKSFMLFDEVYPQGDAVYGNGKIYEENTGYTNFQNRKIQDLWSNYYDTPSGSSWTNDWKPANCTQVGINVGWLFSEIDASGDILKENGGYYNASSNGIGRLMYDSSSILSWLNVTQDNRPVLYNYITEYFSFGGIYVYHGYCEWNDGTVGSGNMHHGQLGTRNQYGVSNYGEYLENLIVPFISEAERDCAKSSLFFWTQSQRNTFDAAYGN